MCQRQLCQVFKQQHDTKTGCMRKNIKIKIYSLTLSNAQWLCFGTNSEL